MPSRQGSRNAQSDLLRTTLHHDNNLADLREVMVTINSILSPDYKRRLRSGTIEREECLALITDITPKALEAWGREAGFTADQFGRLVAEKSFIFRAHVAGGCEYSV